MKKILKFFTDLSEIGGTLMGIRTSKEPSFTVLADFGEIQIRLYPAIVVAETEVAADYAASGGIGFNRLAGYIFGNNRQKQKMAMTTPVFREAAGEKIVMTDPIWQQQVDEKWLMTFVMPAGYALSQLPTPLDEKVLLKEIQAKKIAVLRFSGSLTLERIAEKSQILTDWLSAHQYLPLAKPRSAAYDPPWTLPPLRRNEIHIEVE